MAAARFTREIARHTYDLLPERVSLDVLGMIEEKRLAVRKRGQGYFYYWQELPTEDVVGWVDGVHARMFYGPTGKRVPIGKGVDELYKRVNAWLQGVAYKDERYDENTKSINAWLEKVAVPKQPETPIQRTQTVEVDPESPIYKKAVILARGFKRSGIQGARLAHAVRNELMKQFRGTWAQRGTVIIYKNNQTNERIEIDVTKL